jgi:hypothetical protein
MLNVDNTTKSGVANLILKMIQKMLKIIKSWTGSEHTNITHGGKYIQLLYHFFNVFTRKFLINLCGLAFLF